MARGGRPRRFLRMRVRRLLVVFLVLAYTVPAPAQMPNAYGPSISLDNARKAAAAAVTEMRANKWTMAVAIVDVAF